MKKGVLKTTKRNVSKKSAQLVKPKLLINKPDEACMSWEGYKANEGTCFEEWLRFETEECNYLNWPEECG